MTSSGLGPQEVRLTIPSRLDYLGIINQTIVEIGDCLRLDEDIVDALAIAVIEAGTNAIQHGSEGKGESSVEFRFQVDGDAIHVKVRDQGAGFDLSKIEMATQPDDLLRSRGRGIFLMRTFMDKVDFVFPPSGGTTVQLFKRRRPGST